MKAISVRFGLLELVLVFLLVLAAALPGTAQATSSQLPANASLKVFGSGWECIRDYHRDDGSCKAVTLPANAYLTGSRYGTGWACRYSFKHNQGACNPVALPANAHISPVSGIPWTVY